MRYLLLNTLQALFLMFWSSLWMGAAVVVSIFSAELPLVMARRIWAPPLIWACGAQMQIELNPALDPKGTYIFVMNHQSMLDIAVAVAALPNMRFVLKRALLWVPFLGQYVWRTKQVIVDRSNSEQAYGALQKAAERIRDGISIIAYPEGTRGPGPILPFKRGIFSLAQASGVPIVPVAIEGSGRVLPRGGFKVRPGRIRLKVGAPIPTNTVANTPEAIDLLRKTVREAIGELHVSIGGVGLEPSPRVG